MRAAARCAWSSEHLPAGARSPRRRSRTTRSPSRSRARRAQRPRARGLQAFGVDLQLGDDVRLAHALARLRRAPCRPTAARGASRGCRSPGGTPRSRGSPPSPKIGAVVDDRPPLRGEVGAVLGDLSPARAACAPGPATAFSWTLAARASLVASGAYSSDSCSAAARPRCITSVISSRLSAAGATTLSARSAGRPVLAAANSWACLSRSSGGFTAGRGHGRGRAPDRPAAAPASGRPPSRPARVPPCRPGSAHLLDELGAVGLGAREGGGAGAELGARRVEAAHRVERLRRPMTSSAVLNVASFSAPARSASLPLGRDVVDRAGRLDRLPRARESMNANTVSMIAFTPRRRPSPARSGRAACRPCGRFGGPASSRSRRRS